MFTLQNVVPIPLKEALQNTSSDIWNAQLTIESQKRYFVHAPSGSGKTTLQHFLYGLRHDYEGTIQLAQQNISLQKCSLDQWSTLRKTKLAVIFQDLKLFLKHTALENILLKNQLTDFKTEAEINTMAQALGVRDFLNKPCGILSYGQRQRIAIIRALCQPFEFLLMDEPFAHLDEENIKLACTLIHEACLTQNGGLLLASLGDKYFLEYDAYLNL